MTCALTADVKHLANASNIPLSTFRFRAVLTPVVGALSVRALRQPGNLAGGRVGARREADRGAEVQHPGAGVPAEVQVRPAAR